MSVSILETVQAALEKDDRQYFRDIDADLKKRIDDAPKANYLGFVDRCEQHKFSSCTEFYIAKHAQHKTKEFVQP